MAVSAFWRFGLHLEHGRVLLTSVNAFLGFFLGYFSMVWLDFFCLSFLISVLCSFVVTMSVL